MLSVPDKRLGYIGKGTRTCNTEKALIVVGTCVAAIDQTVLEHELSIDEKAAEEKLDLALQQ